MKIKCPLCGLENYFTGIEDGVNKFCSKCNTPLVESKIPGTTENPYINTKKEKPATNFSESKKILGIKLFAINLLPGWLQC